MHCIRARVAKSSVDQAACELGQAYLAGLKDLCTDSVLVLAGGLQDRLTALLLILEHRVIRYLSASTSST